MTDLLLVAWQVWLAFFTYINSVYIDEEGRLQQSYFAGPPWPAWKWPGVGAYGFALRVYGFGRDGYAFLAAASSVSKSPYSAFAASSSSNAKASR
jgi:hypothetical protein